MKCIMKRLMVRAITLYTSLIIFSMILFSCERKSSQETVVLKFTSWRVEDVDEMNRINALFSASHPDIAISFKPFVPTTYDALIRDSLEKSDGADIMFLRSFDGGRILYEAGCLADLTIIIPKLESYAELPRKAWTTESGVTFGVPSVGVTEGIYYNKTIFTKYGLGEPATWTEFIAACEKLLKGGETVLAQGALDAWTLYELVYCGLGANFYGGEAARQALMAKEARMTDPKFIEAFQMVQSLKKYLPAGFETKGYEELRELFGKGKAAMFISGSWDIGVLEGYGMNSWTLGWFPPPVKKAGDRLQYFFHVDAGIGLNAKTKHMNAAIEYIKWVAGAEYAQAFMNELPGFYSFTPGTWNPGNTLAREMYDVIPTADITLRLMCEKLSSKSPKGEVLLGQALVGMLTGTYTPESAAAYIQEQLDRWYIPGK